MAVAVCVKLANHLLGHFQIEHLIPLENIENFFRCYRSIAIPVKHLEGRFEFLLIM